MLMFVAVVHVLVALLLIGLVLIQDSKGGALGIGGGGGGSGSLLGATGAQTLAARLTRWAGAAFAVTCVTLSLMTAQSTSSVVDIQPASSPQAQPAMPKPSTDVPAETPATAAPAETAPAK